MFRDINDYPNCIIEQTIEKVKNLNQMPRSIQVTTNTEKKKKISCYPIRVKQEKGETTLKSLRNTLESVIPAKDTCKIIYTETKLGSKFHVKYKRSKEHKHDLIYKAQYPDLNCVETHLGEIRKRFSECITDHSDRDDMSHLVEYAEKTRQKDVNIDDFEILSNGYKNNKFKRTLAEALHIKHERPTLSVQEQSVALKLFNCRSTEGQLESRIF